MHMLKLRRRCLDGFHDVNQHGGVVENQFLRVGTLDISDEEDMRDPRERAEFAVAICGIQQVHGNMPVVPRYVWLTPGKCDDVPIALVKQMFEQIASDQAGSA